MILYTIVPMEYIFGDDEESQANAGSSMPDFAPNQEFELVKNGVTFLMQPMTGGRGKINRVISSNPQDYLNPDWQPGSIMSIQ